MTSCHSCAISHYVMTCRCVNWYYIIVHGMPYSVITYPQIRLLYPFAVLNATTKLWKWLMMNNIRKSFVWYWLFARLAKRTTATRANFVKWCFHQILNARCSFSRLTFLQNLPNTLTLSSLKHLIKYESSAVKSAMFVWKRQIYGIMNFF